MRDINSCFSCKFFGSTCNGYGEICTFTPKDGEQDKLELWLSGNTITVVHVDKENEDGSSN